LLIPTINLMILMYICNYKINYFECLVYVILLGFAIKVLLFLFHIWLSQAHVKVPVMRSVLLAGILLKFDSYVYISY